MPLDLQVCPDFSLRLLDETYGAENGTIAEIQAVMVDYFRARTGAFSKPQIFYDK